MINGLDPEILQDFLTESGELLEPLENDLVVLEKDASDPEMLNKAFRALHTIKGSASFLALTNLVTIAHAAEGALNAARNRVVSVDRAMMDLLLQAIDIVKKQMQQVRAGEDLASAPGELVAALAALAEGRQGAKAPAGATPPSPAALAPTPAAPAGTLTLPPEKAELVAYLVADAESSLATIRTLVEAIKLAPDPTKAVGPLPEQAEGLAKAVDFFGLDDLTNLCKLVAQTGDALAEQMPERAEPLVVCLDNETSLLESQVGLLKNGKLAPIDLGALRQRLQAAVDGDGHVAGATTPSSPSTASATAAPSPIPTPEAKKPAAEKTGDKPAPGGDNTIRVEVGRLETLMNLVGELVLQKNRIAALTRKLASGQDGHDLGEAMALAAGGLDRVTGDIQTAVMRTRMQPLDKLFGKYPRLIRDLSSKTGKQMRLVIEGGDTEVDKSVIEELGDPLVHLLRNSADHGLELPDERTRNAKAPEGTITLRASHEGSHVQIQIIDDGRGLSRERIGAKAVERGLCSAEQFAGLSDKEAWAFIFEAGFSTAEKVSDLSGRGVGMDVVRTNIRKIKGTIELFSQGGKGTTVTIHIPLTIAILPAMMVGVGQETYAIPLGNILEIVKPEPKDVFTIGEHPVMRLRDSVLPLIPATDVLDYTAEPKPATPFAVVLAMNEKRVGLMVTRLIGQQEVVIKPLDGVMGRKAGGVSGATVRDDGGVSLIVDVADLMQRAEKVRVKAA